MTRDDTMVNSSSTCCLLDATHKAVVVDTDGLSDGTAAAADT